MTTLSLTDCGCPHGDGHRCPPDRRIARYASAAAALFVAQTIRCEPPSYLEPTDENLEAAFARCVRPPKPDLYPLIREYIESYSPETLF